MSWLDGFDDAGAINLDNRIQRTDKLPEPGFFRGSLGVLGPNLWRGVVESGGLIQSSALQLGSSAIESDLSIGASYFPEFEDGQVQGQREFSEEEAGRIGGSVADSVKDSRPDPRAVGVLGQILGEAAAVVPRAIVGSVVAGPVGAAAAAGAPAGYSRTQTAIAEGIDETTATKMGVIEGLSTAVGAALPAARFVKPVAGDAAISVGANVGLGMAQRGATAELLERNGYHAQAAQYRVMDGTALATDAVLGAFFFGLGRRGGPQAMPTQEQVDAAMVQREVTHFEDGAAPGAPVDLQSANMHRSQLAQAISQLGRGESVTVVDRFNGEFLRRPAATEPVAPTRAEALVMARQELEPTVRDELEQEAAGVLPNVADIRTELASQQRSLESLDASYRDRAKQFQADGMSRKKAEASARQAIEQERMQLTDRVTTLEESLQGNRAGELARRDLAALTRGETPERLRPRIEGRADQIIQGFERSKLASQAERTRTPEHAMDADIESLLDGLGISLKAKDLVPYFAEPSVTSARKPATKAEKATPQPVKSGTGKAETRSVRAEGNSADEPTAEPKLSPESPAELDILRESVARRPDAVINSGFDADGNPMKVKAADALAEVEAEYQTGVKESRSFMAAITCMLRG